MTNTYPEGIDGKNKPEYNKNKKIDQQKLVAEIEAQARKIESPRMTPIVSHHSDHQDRGR